jgi:preprotein translocase subunit SecG
MGIIRTLLVIVDILCALLLVGVILIQKSKNEGMGGLSFGAGMGEALFGSRTGNVLTRATITLATIFLGTSLLLSVLNPTRTSSRSIIDEKVPDIPQGQGPVTGPGPGPIEGPGPSEPMSSPGAAPMAPTAPITLPAPAAEAVPVAAPAAPAAQP